MLDEPTIGIDPIQVVETRQLIKDLGGDHTLIVSTHILPEVSQLCERVIVINEGQIVATDEPENLARRLLGRERVDLQIRGPQQEVLVALESVEGVEDARRINIERGVIPQYRVDSESGMEIRAALARKVIENDWETSPPRSRDHVTRRDIPQADHRGRRVKHHQHSSEREQALFRDARRLHRGRHVPGADRRVLRIRHNRPLRRGQRPRHSETGPSFFIHLPRSPAHHETTGRGAEAGNPRTAAHLPRQRLGGGHRKSTSPACSYSWAILAVTFYYVLLLYVFGEPDTGPVLTGYLGLVLYGAAALGIGMLGSSISSNQIVSAVVGIAILLMLSYVHLIGGIVTGLASSILNGMSMNQHINDFSRGVIDTSSVVFFLSLAAVFIFLTIRSLETRRWR